MTVVEKNREIYGQFLIDLQKKGKIDDMMYGSFKANIEMPSHDRSCSGASVTYGASGAGGIDYGFYLSVPDNTLLFEEEEYKRGLYQTIYRTEPYPGNTPDVFSRIGSILHIKGTYSDKSFEVVISPL